MPRVKPLTAEGKIKYQKKRARDVCFMLMDKYKIKYVDVANATGVTLQAVSQQFKKDSLQLETVLAIIYLSNADKNEIEQIMKAR